ncbi:hypothetical protein GGR53DRAFT_174448 [Hypoxylon sp. FL1150]|nr:hypothetical protein GGR53DRAFT_174448 [Hypoxylon sp. FL1150]
MAPLLHTFLGLILATPALGVPVQPNLEGILKVCQESHMRCDAEIIYSCHKNAWVEYGHCSEPSWCESDLAGKNAWCASNTELKKRAARTARTATVTAPQTAPTKPTETQSTQAKLTGTDKSPKAQSTGPPSFSPAWDNPCFAGEVRCVGSDRIEACSAERNWEDFGPCPNCKQLYNTAVNCTFDDLGLAHFWTVDPISGPALERREEPRL